MSRKGRSAVRTVDSEDSPKAGKASFFVARRLLPAKVPVMAKLGLLAAINSYTLKQECGLQNPWSGRVARRVFSSPPSYVPEFVSSIALQLWRRAKHALLQRTMIFRSRSLIREKEQIKYRLSVDLSCSLIILCVSTDTLHTLARRSVNDVRKSSAM